MEQTPIFRFDWYILDADNKPMRVEMLEACEWFGNLNRRIVDFTQVNNEIAVSTVFLCMDHRLVGKGPPLLFETIIFGGPLDGNIWRYSSWDDAQIGHQAAVRKAREAIEQGRRR